jgi:hypothetical protein
MPAGQDFEKIKAHCPASGYYSPLATRLEGKKLEDLLSDGGRQKLLQGIRSLHQHTTQSR